MTGQAVAEWPRHARIKQNLQATGSSIRLRAYSKTATACSRVTEGNASSHSSMLTPASRFSNKLFTGNRVPEKHGAPAHPLGVYPVKGIPCDSNQCFIVRCRQC